MQLVKPRVLEALKKLDNATKTLKIGRVSKACEKRKVVLSSNLVQSFGFNIGDKLFCRVIGPNEGIEFTPATFGSEAHKTLSVREYRQKSGIKQEAVLDERNQERVTEGLGDATHVRVVMEHQRIRFLPINSSNDKSGVIPFKSMAVCSSGMDLLAMENKGFRVEALLDYRVAEKRDLTPSKDGMFGFSDKTESGLLSALNNSNHLKHIANEDIYLADFELLNELFDGPSYQFCSISLQCDDFANVKAKSLKDASFDEGDSTLDMIVPALDMIRSFAFPSILVEQAAEFQGSDAEKIFRLQMQRMGYKTYSKKINAKDQNGLVNRNRTFVFCTKYNAQFEWPESVVNTRSIMEECIVPFYDEMRDISHTTAMKEAEASGRARHIKPDANVAPSLTKSQSRQAKDTVVFKDGDKVLYPSISQCKKIMGAEAFDLSHESSTELQYEIIGQGVCMTTYGNIMGAIRSHIEQAQGFTKAKLTEVDERLTYVKDRALKKLKETSGLVIPEYQRLLLS